MQENPPEYQEGLQKQREDQTSPKGESKIEILALPSVLSLEASACRRRTVSPSPDGRMQARSDLPIYTHTHTHAGSCEQTV